MIDTYRKLFDVLDGHERRRGLLLLVCFFFQGGADALGIASVVPFMAVVANPQVIETNAYLGSLYGYFSFQSAQHFLIALGTIVFVVLVGSTLFSALTQWVTYRFTHMCNYRISTRLLSTYFSRPYSWFLLQHSAKLGRSVLNEVSTLVTRSLLPSLRILSRLVNAALLIGLIVLSDPTIAFFSTIGLGGLYALIHLGVRRYLVQISKETWNANEERFKVSQEGLAGIKDVKVSGLEEAYLRRYRAPAQRLAHYYAAQETLNVAPKYLLEAIAFGGMILIVIIMLTTREQGLSHALPIITVYAFAGYRLLPALQEIYHSLGDIKFGAHTLDELHRELNTPEAKKQLVHEQPTAHDEQRLPFADALELIDVTFSYPQSHKAALDTVNLRIEAKSSVGFVGTTGAGKTTIVDVILGLLDPSSGELIVDGVTITDENRRQWQRCVGYVPQHIFLADDSIAANIAFGDRAEEIDMKAVEQAARVADIHDFVTRELPDGYQTFVGERGVRLSGGQRQRIGIARALYRDPSVLVLDEATSALDNVTERAVMSAMKKLGQTKTLIIIAHRLTTVQNCDVIFLLDAGRVVASGSYEELCATNATFREMALLD